MNLEALTRRERQVVALRVDYRTMKEIGEALQISAMAAKKHCVNAKRKSGAVSNGELYREARAAGLTP